MSTSNRRTQLAKKALAQLTGSAKCLKLYGPEHPQSRASLEQAWHTIFEIIRESDELVYDFEDGQVFHDRDLFVDESVSCQSFIAGIEGGGGNRLTFETDLTQDELTRFLLLLNEEPEERDDSSLMERIKIAGIESVQVKRMTRRKSNRAPTIGSKSSPESHYTRYEQAISNLSEVLDAAGNQGAPTLSKIQGSARWIAQITASEPEQALALTAIGSRDEYLCHHSANVAIMAAALGHRAGLVQKSVEWLSEAALLHDIGKTRIPAEVLNKPGSLTTDEWALTARHPHDGAQILTALPDAHDSAVIVAFEHHLGHDLGGYPKLSADRKLHLFSRIAQIADVYDGLTSERAYHRPKLRSEAVTLMLGPLEHLFDPTLVRLFFKVIGVYPIGSLLRLSTDNIGLVRGVDQRNLLRPVVKLIDLPDKKTVRLSEYPKVTIVSMLDPASVEVNMPHELTHD